MLLAAAFAAAGGCTVKEDRRPCPCFLDLDYREMLAEDLLSGEPGNVETAVFQPGLACSSSYTTENCPQIEEHETERSQVRVVGVLSSRKLYDFPSKGTLVTYEAGNEIDSVYVHVSDIDCSGEDASCVLRPSKQFSTLFLTDEEGGGMLRSYNMVVKGNTCGFDAFSLEAVSGDYLYTVQEFDRDGRISVRIPRQADNGLVLEFYDKESYRHLFSAPLGQYLFDAGYDPGAGELLDYSFRINFEQTLVYLRIAAWDEEFIYKLFK